MSPTTNSEPTGTPAARSSPHATAGWATGEARPYRDPQSSRLNPTAHSQRRVSPTSHHPAHREGIHGSVSHMRGSVIREGTWDGTCRRSECRSGSQSGQKKQIAMSQHSAWQNAALRDERATGPLYRSTSSLDYRAGNRLVE